MSIIIFTYTKDRVELNLQVFTFESVYMFRCRYNNPAYTYNSMNYSRLLFTIFLAVGVESCKHKTSLLEFSMWARRIIDLLFPLPLLWVFSILYTEYATTNTNEQQSHTKDNRRWFLWNSRIRCTWTNNIWSK
jgi:capsule polysaccharide export protein KpsC/LpsZ